ncbi:MULTISPECIES: G5 domain-containing protein [Microbacterium]|uniref:G5 domain-containing protein n=1 Tax=Microbacterium TaxID=33882 RepID=UPI00300FC3AF
MTAPSPAPRSTRRRWWILPLTALGVAVVGGLLARWALPVLIVLCLALAAIAGVVIVRGAAPRLGIHGRGAGWAALGAVVLLVIGGSTGNAATTGPSTADRPASVTPSASATPQGFVAAAPSTPSPEPTTYADIEVRSDIDFERTTVESADIDEGTTAVITAGQVGTRLTVFRIGTVGGVEVSREIVGETVLAEPVAEVTAIGTRIPPAAEPVPFAAQEPTGPECHPSYAGVCVPIDSDVDCQGGGGNGPSYVAGPLSVVGPDEYDLDRDGDGIACD